VSGAGAAARNSIGLVLVGGMAVGTVFTLFVIPSVYMLIARDHLKAAAADSELTDSALPDNVCRAPWTDELAVPAGCRLVSDKACNWTVDCGQHPGGDPQWRRAS
jgi:hypothetical protein